MRDGEPKIYLLPNLMTAGNLFCGFTAILKIIEGALLQVPGAVATGNPYAHYHWALVLILGACVFDLLDGRMARMAGAESPFGREFDSLADVVSFGVAPALLVYRIVLQETPYGWIVASVYLVCGALRLARFNCIAAEKQPGSAVDKDFSGIPIPAAAGVTASITLFMLGLQENDREIGPWRYALPPLLLFLSWMMFSHFRYPSFKAVNWRTQKSVPRLLLVIIIILLTVRYYHTMPAILFLSYLLYGFFRPFVSKRLRKEIEEEEEDDEEDVVPPANPAAP
ncbi:MAG TPA: CDP-diacylglycerol--serine O-phosphatidyltransferase [Chthoniobacterales bacterium]|jgi:CDP-diacylglycerol--serine O-phosphatidyltransferase